ncbi:MAG: hypothetical protein N2Z82_01830 [Thermomicrobium sp.]|nr:hypothetical protein [Thermomicrobium sp.]
MEPLTFFIVLRRCGESCELWAGTTLWVSGFGSTFLTFIVSTIVAARRLADLGRSLRLRTVSVAALDAAQGERPIELHGRAWTPEQRSAPLTQRAAAAYELHVTGRWRKTDSTKQKHTSTSSTVKVDEDVFLDDGSGKVRIDLSEALRYWPSQSKEWSAVEAPEWARALVSPLEGGTLTAIEVTEELLPLGSEFYVIGLRRGDRVVASVASTTGERTTRRGLLGEFVTSLLVLFLSGALTLRLGPSTLENIARSFAGSIERDGWLDRLGSLGWGLLVFVFAFFIAVFVAFLAHALIRAVGKALAFR